MCLLWAKKRDLNVILVWKLKTKLYLFENSICWIKLLTLRSRNCQWSNLPNITTTVSKVQQSWSRDVSRMSDHRILNQLFYGELWQGKQIVDGRIKRFKDSLKVHQTGILVDISFSQKLAPSYHKGANTEKRRSSLQAERKRESRKTRSPTLHTPILPISVEILK